jgi:serine/threonine protein kinase
MDLLNNLGQYRISHGDLKHSNILITDNGPVLTDLDGMKVHRWDWIHRARQTKDITRFAKKTGQEKHTARRINERKFV